MLYPPSNTISKSLRNIGGVSMLLPLLDLANSNELIADISESSTFIPNILSATSSLLKGTHGVANSMA